jgi:hypothetical protein
MIRTLLASLAFIAFHFAASAQFNDTTHYYVNLASTGIINKTNDGSSYVLNNNLRFSLYRKRISLNTAHGFIYGQQQEHLTNRDMISTLDFNVLPKEKSKWYYWGLGSFERSYSLKINHRIQAGLGIGYNIVDRKHALVVLSDGILYEKSNVYDNSSESIIDYHTFRNSFRLKFRFVIHEIVTIDGTDFLQHSLSDGSDYIIKSLTTVSVKLRKWLSFTSSVTYNKVNLTQRENLLINFGITAERYF